MNERAIFKEVCENDFAFFAKHFLKVLEAETDIEWNWHIDLLCHYCEQVYYGEIPNLDINIPPRMLKTSIVSILFPAWIWTKNPSFKIIGASSNNSLSSYINIKRREVIRSSEYQSLWHIQIKENVDRNNLFENTFNGSMASYSVNSKISGKGAHLLLSDDLLDAKEAFSKSARESVKNFFSQAFYNRVQDKKIAKRININQRLHVDDISGFIKQKYKYQRLVIPMQRTEKNDGIKWDDPREIGEFIQPSRYAEKEKDDEYDGLGVYGWSSQMQQNPVPLGGGIIKEEWIRYYEGHIACQKYIITADLTFKGNKKSDYVCFQCWGIQGPYKYMIDILRGQWSYKETKDMFKIFCAKHSYATRKIIEDAANGPALISDLKSEITGLESWPPDGSNYRGMDKIQRLHLCSVEYETGSVYLAKNNKLIEKYVEELLSFTDKGSATGNDDMVDTSTMALLELKVSRQAFSA